MPAVHLSFVCLRSAADEASANAVLAIVYQVGVARRATARRPIAHASHCRARTSRFAADVAIASAAAAIARNETISDTPDNTARSAL